MCFPALLALVLLADDARPTIPLWPTEVPEPRVVVDMPERSFKGPDGIDRRYNVTQPRLVMFAPENAVDNAAAVIVIPGGGFGVLADGHEGADACLWLAKLGIRSFLLDHRCPTNNHEHPNLAPVQDAQRAVQLVRQRAAEWKLDPQKIGVLGFSAGGQVALVAATNELKFPAEKSPPDAHRPDFLLLLYPWMIYDPPRQKLRADVNLDSRLPPTFIAQCADDKASLPHGSALLALEMYKRQVPVELHVYGTGGHGFGMQKRGDATGPTDWPLRAADWLRLRGLTMPAAGK